MRNQLKSFFASLPPDVSRLLPPSYPLVIGVSGGPDSLALLHLLVEDAAFTANTLVVGHLDHSLRPESHKEAGFVANVCAQWGIRCIVRVAQVENLARDERLSLEEAGRIARYRFLRSVATDVGARLVAVGHNADDQAETVLMHFLRGTGLAGLRGMGSHSAYPGAPALHLLRPLLEITRERILAYCHEQGLKPLHDESNLDVSFFRNRLRHELLPMLESYNPQIRRQLVHTAKVVSADYELLETLCDEAWRAIVIGEGEGWVLVDRARWRGLSLSLRRQTLRYAVASLRASLRDIGFPAVELARAVAEEGQLGAQASLPGNLTLTVGYESWRLERAEVSMPAELPQVPDDAPVPLSVPSQTALANGWMLELRPVPVAEALRELDEDSWRVFIDGGVARKLTLRGRVVGERFEPLGMGGHSVSIADLMINEKVPARLRGAWPIVADSERVVWVVGLRLDRHARITEATEKIVRLSCRHITNDAVEKPDPS